MQPVSRPKMHSHRQYSCDTDDTRNEELCFVAGASLLFTHDSRDNNNCTRLCNMMQKCISSSTTASSGKLRLTNSGDNLNWQISLERIPLDVVWYFSSFSFRGFPSIGCRGCYMQLIGTFLHTHSYTVYAAKNERHTTTVGAYIISHR